MREQERFPKNPRREHARFFGLPSLFGGNVSESLPQPKEWTINHNTFAHYKVDFDEVDKQNRIAAKLEALYDKPHPVVVDLLADTSAVASLHDALGRKGKFICVGVEDDRTPEQRRQESAKGIHHIQRDLSDRETWEELFYTVGDTKVDIFMGRGYGALNHVPTEIIYQRNIMKYMWHMADPDGGIIILQTPDERGFRNSGIPMQRWVNAVQDAGIYARYLDNYRKFDLDHTYGLLLLQKEDASQKLPDILRM